MGGNDKSGSLIVTDIILLITFIGLIIVIFDLSRFFFIGELILLAVILCLAFIAMIAAYLGVRFGWALLSAVFAVILVDIIFIYFNAQVSVGLFFLLIIMATIGFIISIVSIGRGEEIESEPEIEESFEPGKFVGSDSGRSYHAPKCDWAKRIKKDKQVWFDSKEEARKKGYKAHSCLK